MDKVIHWVGGALIFTILFKLGAGHYWSIIAVTTVMTGKEAYDELREGGTGWDNLDLAAGVAGGVVAGLLL